MSFYNTIKLKGTELKAHELRANKQDEQVYFICNRLKSKRLTPRRVWWAYKKYYGHCLLTSIRRSIDTLKKKGLLIETGEIIKSTCPVDNIRTSEKEIRCN